MRRRRIRRRELVWMAIAAGLALWWLLRPRPAAPARQPIIEPTEEELDELAPLPPPRPFLAPRPARPIMYARTYP